jgi:hypothetical protein
MDGKILEDTMKKMRYRLDDLLEQLRQKDVFDVMQVKYAIFGKGRPGFGFEKTRVYERNHAGLEFADS